MSISDWFWFGLLLCSLVISTISGWKSMKCSWFNGRACLRVAGVRYWQRGVRWIRLSVQPKVVFGFRHVILGLQPNESTGFSPASAGCLSRGCAIGWPFLLSKRRDLSLQVLSPASAPGGLATDLYGDPPPVPEASNASGLLFLKGQTLKVSSAALKAQRA